MTTLMEEEPYAAVVNNEHTSDTCSKCFTWNSDDLERVKLSRCAGCHVLSYCSSKCQKADWKDHKTECELLRSADFVPSENSRLVMRMIEKSRKQPEFKAFNGRTYDSLKHNSSKSRENEKVMAVVQAIYSEICLFMGSKAPNFATVFFTFSKKRINEFPICDGSWLHISRGVGLYLGLSVLDHSCRPDAFIVNQGSKILLRTTKKDLVYSDKLTISYDSVNFFMDTDLRRAELLNSHFFFCKCEECEDIESNKKSISGRPSCCPNSWFSTADRICSNCNKEVSSELVDKAKDAMERLRSVISAFSKGKHEESALLVPEWIKLFDSCKEVLSDENTLLFAIASLIYVFMAPTDTNISCNYVDLCAVMARKRPHSVYSATLFTRRQLFYEATQKPLREAMEAIKEAIDSAQVVFGAQHDLTQSLLQKKMIYQLMNLCTR